MESRIDKPELDAQSPDQITRHIMLSNLRGVVTEVERIGAEAEGYYTIRSHKGDGVAGSIPDVGTPSDGWIGFRYSNSHWSFLKQASR